MLDVGNGGSPAEKYERLIRGSRAPSPEEFEMQQMADHFETQKAMLPPWPKAKRRMPNPLEGMPPVFLPKIRGAERIGREISREAQLGREVAPPPPTRPLPPAGPLNQQAPRPRPF